jgi:AraC family transcriptional regulator
VIIMLVHARNLRRGGSLALALPDDGTVTVVYGEGGGCTLNVKDEAAGLWIPLHGSLQVHSSSLAMPVRRGELLVTESGRHTRALGRSQARWLTLLAGPRTWRQVLSGVGETPGPNPQWLPERHPAGHALRRRAIALARAATPVELENATHAVIYSVIALQAPLYGVIARCPGRTFAMRRQVFLRLQRVRNFMSASCDQEIDNDVLARMASYSPCHFLRTFNHVFQETPHVYLVNQRLQRAHRLLRWSDLAVTEVALASGFETRSAFSRLFRQRFGTTAMDARRQQGSFG